MVAFGTRDIHPKWKGDEATQASGRQRARRWFKPKPCELCGNLKTEIHHKDGDELNNNPLNIQWLCRRCHLKIDGRLKQSQERFHLQHVKKMKDVAFSILMMTVHAGNRGLKWRDYASKIKVSSATLAKYLSFLQKQEYIEKRVVAMNPISIKYFITQKGQDSFVNEGRAMVKKMKRTQELISKAVVRVAG